MNRVFALNLGLILGLATLPFSSSATTYLDSTGEAIGASILDISSVEVNNTATDLIVKINLVGDPVATDWGKYMIAFDTTAGGDTTGNGWNRPISMSSGMDYWVGGWADWGNGAELRQWTNPGWPTMSNPVFSKDTSSVTMQFPFSGLGLSIGNSFVFDVFTSGGGGSDGAIDALANPGQTIANWSDPYNSQSSLSYTISPVPEPTSLVLLGIGVSLLVNRLRRR